MDIFEALRKIAAIQERQNDIARAVIELRDEGRSPSDILAQIGEKFSISAVDIVRHMEEAAPRTKPAQEALEILQRSVH
jgi:superfamily II helicase